MKKVEPLPKGMGKVSQVFNDERTRGVYQQYGLDGHNGEDVSGWHLPVRSPIDGRVHYAGEGAGNGVLGASAGRAILIESHDGTVMIELAHLDVIYVEAGQYVSAGSYVALSGNTGASSGPHLHWGALPLTGGDIDRENGFMGRVDPREWLAGGYE
ncbi:M23 family metallopeptidase [Zhihengliuella halotolerans]|uniref:Peptidase M23-like protein n=1 Tax=Zhihengliuella halotolerans TaxID=370736 RepID=A0A4Q8ABA9_9MICC|nr:M23 family metallopeptidase [Zhihengliuella halotolerans]RZU61440.1 peptidase M23-like protein [Zhihengliuella halotolerans]